MTEHQVVVTTDSPAAPLKGRSEGHLPPKKTSVSKLRKPPVGSVARELLEEKKWAER